MEKAFIKYLLTSSSLNSAINGRADWAVRPQGQATPALVLFVISSIPYYSDEGSSGLTFARIQIDCWGKTYALAKDTSKLVTDKLCGGSASFTQDGFVFQNVNKADEQDSFERGAAAEDLYRVRLDFEILYKGD